MTHDPSIPGAGRPIDPAPAGAPGRAKSTGAQGAQTSQGTQKNPGAAFKALLDKLETKAQGLREATDALTEPGQLSGAVDHARASLDDAVSLGDRLLEAYRASRHGGDEGSSES